MTIAAGTKLARFEIRSLLGAGGMGEVYLAEDAQLRRRVALKILPGELALLFHSRSRGSYDLLTFYTGCSRFGVLLVTAIRTCLALFTSQICHRRIGPLTNFEFKETWFSRLGCAQKLSRAPN